MPQTDTNSKQSKSGMMSEEPPEVSKRVVEEEKEIRSEAMSPPQEKAAHNWEHRRMAEAWKQGCSEKANTRENREATTSSSPQEIAATMVMVELGDKCKCTSTELHQTSSPHQWSSSRPFNSSH
jgi:hypothetical protein